MEFSFSPRTKPDLAGEMRMRVFSSPLAAARGFFCAEIRSKTAAGYGIVRRYAAAPATPNDIHMTTTTRQPHDAKVRASGVAYPDLERKIQWRDGEDLSEADVWSRSSGAVMLVVERKAAGWQWEIFGWLGVQLTSGHAQSRENGKKAAVRWWGTMTVADRAGMEA